jgi:multiple sugar transport system permease protein
MERLINKSVNIKKFLKDNYTGWLFNMPLIIGLLAFTLIPVIYSFVFSFYDTDGVFDMTFVAFQNYIDIFKNDRFIGTVIKNTVLFTLINVPLSLILSYFLALLVNNSAKGIKAFRVLYYLPCMIPAVVGGLLWKDMFDQTFGVFNKLLGLIGLGPYPFFSNENTALLSVFIMNFWSIGAGMILWLAAFRNIGKQYYEAAELDGANAFTKVIKITLPMSTSTIFYNMITSIIGTLQYNGTLTYASRGGRGENDSLYMYAVMIYRKGILGDELGYASALAWLLLLVIALITILIFKTSSWVFYGEES